jgi:hypothetical protein
MYNVDDPARIRRRWLDPAMNGIAGGLFIALVASSSVAQSEPTRETPSEPDPALIEHMESETPTDRPFNFTTYWENDGSFAKPNDETDRRYTNGLAFSFAHRPQWARDLAEYIPFSENFEGGNIDGGYTFGQLMYTPDDIEDPRPIPDDHPYNGYLYVGAFLQREKDATLDHFQLEIGVIGEASLAGSAQDFVHDVRDFDRPRGWRHQHSDEMMVQSYIRKKWRIDGVDFGMAGRARRLRHHPTGRHRHGHLRPAPRGRADRSIRGQPAAGLRPGTTPRHRVHPDRAAGRLELVPLRTAWRQDRRAQPGAGRQGLRRR